MAHLRGLFTMSLIIVSTVVICIPLFAMALVALLASQALRRRIRLGLDRCIVWWTGFNRWHIGAFNLTHIKTDWPQQDQASTQSWYLVMCNHQSWTDIIVLQTVLHGRIPPLKFFTKQELIWIPFLGIAMYLLGFPYVKRASKSAIEKNPKLRTADRDAVIRACERFREHPSSVLNFTEGTRFTPQKHAQQQSPYKNLLNPKVGGLNYVITGLEDKLHEVIDVTIRYPLGVPSFWMLMQGRCRQVEVEIEHLAVPQNIIDPDPAAQRAKLAHWLDERWQQKDQRLETPETAH